jgi:hypothetical protein
MLFLDKASPSSKPPGADVVTKAVEWLPHPLAPHLSIKNVAYAEGRVPTTRIPMARVRIPMALVIFEPPVAYGRYKNG